MNKDEYKDELKRYWKEAIVGVEGYSMVIIKNVFLKAFFLFWFSCQVVVVYNLIVYNWMMGSPTEWGVIIDIVDILLLLLLGYDVIKHVSFLIYNGVMYLICRLFGK